ncbi:transmembrane prolyl 4-hydroxylase-like [Mizuhopecten yessoensis]|uniref:Transmembrane prolyl 4-hydroxylase n=1 Tax=Mizuhopecten yessoensis TaxID=6573 RepID=A0A210PHS5_MIZYE|nr:transmembrane prolyl 4-hydroxylase-like [Mizuhopecten yessoensis]OWF36049.1 Transmembrane prolyl 4-hydroxylase [Mizuhopecten yessoensis]
MGLHPLRGFLLLLVMIVLLVRTEGEQSQGSGTFCLTIAGIKTCQNSSDIRLSRLQGKQVGDVQGVVAQEGRVLKLKTVSQKPLVIEIPEFLTAEECDHFIETAHQEGLKDSVTTDSSGHNKDGFKLMDKDRDKKLSVNEMRLTIESGMDIYPDREDILKMYADTGLDKDGDEQISAEELKDFSPADLMQYFNEFLQQQPEKHSRFSKQVWLFPDNSKDRVFDQVQDRVSRAVDLPIELIKMSDFQVVTYGVKGHYNAHYDSSEVNDKIPCCTRRRTRQCRICRYMTVLFYLSDVEGGGETAFPLAGNDIVDMVRVQDEQLMNLYKKCSDANLHVTPAKGKAIIWYNHQVDPDTGWLGAMDKYTYHGGCPVTTGTKWIANFWIKTTDNKLEDLHRMIQFAKLNNGLKQKDEL